MSEAESLLSGLDVPVAIEKHGAHYAIYSPDSLHRFLLTREWTPDAHKLVVIGLNPSTATAEYDDPTIRRCIAYAKAWGYGGLVMLNLFAWRATDPKAMQRAHRMGSDIIGTPVNDTVLDLYATAGRNVLCAWGAGGRFLARGFEVTNRLAKRHARLQALGVTSGGEPKHPLYLRSALTPVGYP